MIYRYWKSIQKSDRRICLTQMMMMIYHLSNSKICTRTIWPRGMMISSSFGQFQSLIEEDKSRKSYLHLGISPEKYNSYRFWVSVPLSNYVITVQSHHTPLMQWLWWSRKWAYIFTSICSTLPARYLVHFHNRPLIILPRPEEVISHTEDNHCSRH